MGNVHADDSQGDGEWIALGEFARRVGVTRGAVYGRVRRGTLQTRPKGNRGLELLWQPPERYPNGEGNGYGDVAHNVTAQLDAARAQVGELRVQLAVAQGATTARDAVIAELRDQVAWLRLPWWRRLIRSA